MDACCIAHVLTLYLNLPTWHQQCYLLFSRRNFQPGKIILPKSPPASTTRLRASKLQLQPLSQYKYIRVWRICRLRTEENVVCQSGGSSQGSGSIRQDCQGCICISTLCYERLQRRACRMSSPGSRVPKVPVTRFVVSHRFHDICPSRNLFLLAATERSRVLCILGANDEWQRLEVVLWWIVYVGMNHHRFLGYSPIKRRNKSD